MTDPEIIRDQVRDLENSFARVKCAMRHAERKQMDKITAQMFLMACLTALGAVAIVFDGEIGMTIAVAVAGGLGYMAKGIVDNMKVMTP